MEDHDPHGDWLDGIRLAGVRLGADHTMATDIAGRIGAGVEVVPVDLIGDAILAFNKERAGTPALFA